VQQRTGDEVMDAVGELLALGWVSGFLMRSAIARCAMISAPANSWLPAT
jgi:hypothetical protein